MDKLLLSILISINMINPIDMDKMENIEINKIDTAGIETYINNKLNDIEKQKEIDRINSVNFNQYNLLEKSNINHNEMITILSNTNLNDVAWTIAQCEIDYGVNAFLLTALIAEESGWGNSSRAINQNNLSGYAVYSDGSPGRIFGSRSESVIETARLLKEDYLTKEGIYHNGYSIYDVNKLYSANDEWADNIISIANTLLERYEKEFR